MGREIRRFLKAESLAERTTTVLTGHHFSAYPMDDESNIEDHAACSRARIQRTNFPVPIPVHLGVYPFVK